MILAATEAIACKPEAHCLLTAYTGTVSENPASNIPILAIAAPAPKFGIDKLRQIKRNMLVDMYI